MIKKLALREPSRRKTEKKKNTKEKRFVNYDYIRFRLNKAEKREKMRIIFEARRTQNSFSFLGGDLIDGTDVDFAEIGFVPINGAAQTDGNACAQT